MLSRDKQERMRKAIETNLRQAIQTDRGECIAVDDETGDEWGHKWRGGETRIFVEDGVTNAEYVFAVRVELVAVVPE